MKYCTGTRRNSAMSALLARTALVAMAMLVPAHAVAAQAGDPAAEEDAADPAAAGDIVVTAQRRSESMMSVPVAISAFTGEALASAGIQNVQSVQIATPSLVVNNTGPNVQPFIRGVGSRLLQNGFDPSVATYVDGRYIARQSAISLDLFDVQRVEVLKGPQGVLFGRNASAGAIRIITNDVSDRSEGLFKFGFGNYNAFTAQAMANVPLSDSFGIRVAGLTIQRDGFAKNLDARGRKQWDDKHVTSVRGKARFEQGPVEAQLALSYWNQKDNAGNDTVALPPLQFNTGIVRGGITGVRRRDVASQVKRPYDKKEFAGEFNLGIDLGGARLSAITTLSDLDNELTLDGDGTSTVLVDAFITERSKSFAQELQLASDNDGPLEWIAGLYYFRDKTGYDIYINNGSIFSQGHQEVKTTSYAAFGQIGWKVSDALKLVVGGRYIPRQEGSRREPFGRAGHPDYLATCVCSGALVQVHADRHHRVSLRGFARLPEIRPGLQERWVQLPLCRSGTG